MRSKLEEFDQHANAAVDHLIELLQADREQLIVYARGKLVWGHYRYQDKLMYEYEAQQLVAEAVEELGDAINYLTRRQALVASERPSPTPPPTRQPSSPKRC